VRINVALRECEDEALHGGDDSGLGGGSGGAAGTFFLAHNTYTSVFARRRRGDVGCGKRG
jgi:hypothetical protein